MPFQAAPGVAYLTIHNKLDGQDYINGLYFLKTAAGLINQTELAALANQFANNMMDPFFGLWPNVMVHQKIVCRAIDAENSWVVEDLSRSGETGGFTGPTDANNLAFSITFKTGLAGATNNGRNSFGGLLKSSIDNSMIALSAADAIRDVYAMMIGPSAVATGWTWCIVSRKVAVPGDPATPRPVTAVVYNDRVVDSQKTRLPGRGQ